MTAREWVQLAHSDQPIACHQTITRDDDWDAPDLRQCKGAAIYRANLAKMPRNSQDARHGTSTDVESVFATDDEFVNYHEQMIRGRRPLDTR